MFRVCLFFKSEVKFRQLTFNLPKRYGRHLVRLVEQSREFLNKPFGISGVMVLSEQHQFRWIMRWPILTRSLYFGRIVSFVDQNTWNLVTISCLLLLLLSLGEGPARLYLVSLVWWNVIVFAVAWWFWGDLLGWVGHGNVDLTRLNYIIISYIR